MQPTSSPDFAVIGGGIVGASIAYGLASAGDPWPSSTTAMSLRALRAVNSETSGCRGKA